MTCKAKLLLTLNYITQILKTHILHPTWNLLIYIICPITPLLNYRYSSLSSTKISWQRRPACPKGVVIHLWYVLNSWVQLIINSNGLPGEWQLLHLKESQLKINCGQFFPSPQHWNSSQFVVAVAVIANLLQNHYQGHRKFGSDFVLTPAGRPPGF